MMDRARSIAACLLYSALWFGCGRTQPAPPPEPSISLADQAYFAMDLPSSRRMLERLIESKAASPKDLAGALTRLALQDWQFYRDDSKARTRLEQADRLGVDRSATWAAMSRIAREAGRYDDALAAARTAMELAGTNSETAVARSALYRASLEEATALVAKGRQPAETHLSEARRVLNAALKEEPGEPRASKALLGIALLQRDGPGALGAWRQYFQLRSGQPAPGMLEDSDKNLQAVLPRWQGSGITRDDRIRLVLALAGSRFFQYAALIARSEAVADAPAVNDVLAYADFLNQVQQVTEDYFRDIALGRKTGSAYQKNLDAAFTGLWQRLQFPGERPPYSRARFLSEVGNRFGTELRLGANGNFGGLDLILGHRVGVEQKTVQQYGRRVELRLVSVDMMAENGYSGWFWDGRAAPGGWGAYPEIAWIREAYLGEPYHYWRELTDARERSAWEEESARLGAGDDRLAAANPYAYLPGVTRRAYYAQAKRIYDSQKAQGYGGTDLCLAFVSEFLRVKLESSILAHEGRHAIDQAQFSWRSHLWSAETTEFRAKLSEVAFAPDPKFALVSGSILGDPNVAGRSTHSSANLRMKKMLLKWMERHSSEIRGLNRSRPLLPQLDLITNDQILEACRQADSMAP